VEAGNFFRFTRSPLGPLDSELGPLDSELGPLDSELGRRLMASLGRRRALRR